MNVSSPQKVINSAMLAIYCEVFDLMLQTIVAGANHGRYYGNVRPDVRCQACGGGRSFY